MSSINPSGKKGFWSRLASFFSGCDNCCCQPRSKETPTETIETVSDDKPANGKPAEKSCGCENCKGK